MGAKEELLHHAGSSTGATLLLCITHVNYKRLNMCLRARIPSFRLPKILNSMPQQIRHLEWEGFFKRATNRDSMLATLVPGLAASQASCHAVQPQRLIARKQLAEGCADGPKLAH